MSTEQKKKEEHGNVCQPVYFFDNIRGLKIHSKPTFPRSQSYSVYDKCISL